MLLQDGIVRPVRSACALQTRGRRRIKVPHPAAGDADAGAPTVPDEKRRCHAKSLFVSTHCSRSSSFWPSAGRLRYAADERLGRADPAGPMPTATWTDGPRHRWGRWESTSTEWTDTSGPTPSTRSLPGCRSRAPGNSSIRISYRTKVLLWNRNLFSKSSPSCCIFLDRLLLFSLPS